MVMVVMPRPAGQPIDCSRATNSSSSDSPVITSGMTSGAVVIALSVKRPRNWREARQAEAGERAQDHRAGGVDDRDFQRNPGGVENLLVVEQRVIPLQRGRVRRVPHRHQLRGVEGKHHHRQDGHVQEREAEGRGR